MLRNCAPVTTVIPDILWFTFAGTRLHTGLGRKMWNGWVKKRIVLYGVLKQMKENGNTISSAPSLLMGNNHRRPAASLLKYYIHDSIDALRFELCGELTEWDVAELNGCWRTARTTLGSRKLILDVRRLTAADEGGRQWLHAMSSQGASFIPDGWFPSQLSSQSGQPNLHTNSLRKNTIWDKLVDLCPGLRVFVPKPSTPVQ
jgi:hypothetical protein